MKTTRSLLLIVLVLVSAATGRAEDTRPNFVFLIADDLGWKDVEFHGGNVPTPNLNRLLAEGMELTQHYVAPVCSPTRAGLLTGRYWSRFDVTTPTNELALPFGTVTLASALREAGYETCLTGKWHLGSKPEWGPNHFGFDHAYGSLAGGVAPWNHHYKKGPYSVTWHRNGELIVEEGHVTDLLAGEAARWIGERDGSKPFFLYVPFTAVHLPIREPEEWMAKVPKSIEGAVPRQYAACVLHLDDAVGRILAAVEEAGEEENTVVVFTSDNGGSTSENNDTKYPDDRCPNGRLPGNNLPLRGKKGDTWEGGIRVPTIVRWPGSVKPGTTLDQPVHIVDWMPTFTALAKSEADGEALRWDGMDLANALRGEAPLPLRAIYTAGARYRSKVLREGDWKLVVTPGAGKEAKERVELYHINNDPSETKDLAAEEPDRVADLREKLEEISARDGEARVKG